MAFLRFIVIQGGLSLLGWLTLAMTTNAYDLEAGTIAWRYAIGGVVVYIACGVFFLFVLVRVFKAPLSKIIWFFAGLRAISPIILAAADQEEQLVLATLGDFPATLVIAVGSLTLYVWLHRTLEKRDGLYDVGHAYTHADTPFHKPPTYIDTVSWDEVILPEHTKKDLYRMQRILAHAKEFLAEYKSKVPSGLLLYGPPGTGKTLIARTVAAQAGYAFISVSPADVVHAGVGESEKAIARIYHETRRHTPCIVLLDEIDAIAGRRSGGGYDSGGGGRAHDNLVNQLLSEIDGFTQRHSQVFTVGTTNLLSKVDDAVQSRLSYQIEIPLPDKDARRALFALHMRGYQDKLDYPLTSLVKASAGMSGRDIATICQWAAVNAFSEQLQTVGYNAFKDAFERLGRGLPYEPEPDTEECQAALPAPLEPVRRTPCSECFTLGTVLVKGERVVCPSCRGTGYTREGHRDANSN